ncbi:MAG TPA: hypothetical protein VE866_05695 [Candidatus Binatia bacterium]|nr:hypothetical protein [Candidatus Binatia bacterium]
MAEGKQINGSRTSTRRAVLFFVVLILFAGAYLAGRYYSSHRYDSFAQCLASKQAKMYGLYWCPHCADQKAMFGASFHYVPYVECAIKGSPRELVPACKVAGVTLFPSWQFGMDPPHEGVLSLQALSQRTGCSLP